MEFNDLPTCCGIRLHTGFSNTLAAMDRNNYTPEEVKEYLRTSISNYQANMVTLNTEQMAVLGDTFKENGFEVVKEFYYAGHGNNIYVLMKVHEINNKPKIFLT